MVWEVKVNADVDGSIIIDVGSVSAHCSVSDILFFTFGAEVLRK